MKILKTKRAIPLPNQNLKIKRLIIVASIVSLAAFASVQIFPPQNAAPYSAEMLEAAQIMERAISVIGSYCYSAGIGINETVDPNRTGLIGAEISPIATTLGNLEAKRTTTNPNFAAMVVQLLEKAGVSTDDTVAIGCSASFPALMIATLAATKAMKVYPILIISLGSSSYGATNPDFNLLHIYEILLNKNIFKIQPAAISLGGDRDIGRDFEPGVREKLLRQIHHSRIPFIFEDDFQKNIAQRMQIFLGDSEKRKISAFINIGGSYANIGTSELVLKLKPGINEEMQIPPKVERGVLFEMAARNITTIHLLFVRGLALQYGLPWDPIPLPKVGEFVSYIGQSSFNSQFLIIAGVYFVVLIALLIYGIYLELIGFLI